MLKLDFFGHYDLADMLMLGASVVVVVAILSRSELPSALATKRYLIKTVPSRTQRTQKASPQSAQHDARSPGLAKEGN